MLHEKVVVSQFLKLLNIGYVSVWNDKRQGYRRLKYFVTSPKDLSEKIEAIRILLKDKFGDKLLFAGMWGTHSAYTRSCYVSLVVKIAY